MRASRLTSRSVRVGVCIRSPYGTVDKTGIENYKPSGLGPPVPESETFPVIGLENGGRMGLYRPQVCSRRGANSYGLTPSHHIFLGEGVAWSRPSS